MEQELCNSEMVPLIRWYGWRRCFELFDEDKGFAKAHCKKPKGHEGNCEGSYSIMLEWDNPQKEKDNAAKGQNSM